MSRILQKLHAAHILTEDLALPEDPYDLECTYRGLCRLPDVPRSRRRRIDILSIPWTSRGAALLYYTVSSLHFFVMTYRILSRKYNREMI
jgi:DNA polymerase lambda